MNKPRIEVLSHIQMAAHHLTDMLHIYNLDTTNSPLSMPAPIPFWTHAHVVRRTILSLAERFD